MNSIIEIMYLAACLVSIAAMVPQVRQLTLTKQSDEFNLTTWSVWVGNQAVALMYGLSIHATAFIIVNLVWFVFYLLMVALIIKYRTKNPVLATELNVTTAESSKA